MSSSSDPQKILEFYDLAKDGDPEADYSRIELPSKRYHIIKLVGKGGAKNVYEVFDNLAERKVALAMPRSHLSREQYPTFMKEAKINAKLDHPNIIKVYDIGVSKKNIPFFTMELKRGKTLKHFIERDQNQLLKKPDDIKSKLNIMLKICDALCYAHAKGLIHMDIKPSNIQVGKYGDILVCDWGLSQINENAVELDQISDHPESFDPNVYQDLTRIGKVKGTPGYMAPEQWNPYLEQTFQTDIFACGVLLLELLTGFLPPPSQGGASRTIRDIRLRLEENTIPVSIQAIIKKATAQEAGDRYHSMEMFKQDLERFSDGFSPMAESAGWLRRSQLFMQRHKKRVLSLSMYLLAVFSIIAIFFLLVKNVEEERDLLIAQEEKISSDLLDWEKYYAELNTHDIPDMTHDDIFETLREYGPSHKNFEVYLLANTLRYEKIKKYNKLRYSAMIYFIRQDFNHCLNLLDPDENSELFIQMDEEKLMMKDLRKAALKCIDFSKTKENIIKDSHLEDFFNACLEFGNIELSKYCLSHDFSVRWYRQVYENLLPDMFRYFSQSNAEILSYDAYEHKIEMKLTVINKIKSYIANPFFLRCNHLVIHSNQNINCSVLINSKIKHLSVFGADLENPTLLNKNRDLSIIEIDKPYFEKLSKEKLKRKKVFVNASSVSYPPLKK